MNRTSVTAMFLAATVSFTGFALAEDMPGMPGMKMPPTTAPTSQPATQQAGVDLGNTVCPVSGDKVGESKLTETYEGKIYHFCCADCPVTFKKDPAKFAKLVAADPEKYGIKK